MRWKKTEKLGNLLILFIAYALTSMCLFPQTGKTKDSVRVVHNKEKGKWTENPKLSLHLIRTIGGLNVTNKNQIFSEPDEVALDKDDCLYVSDQRDNRILKYGPDSCLLGTIGRRGQGPGEFTFLASFDVDAQCRIYVNDLMKCKILSPKGEELQSISLPKSTVGGDIRILKSGEISIGGYPIIFSEKENTKELKLIQIFDGEGNLQKEFGEIRSYGNPLLNSYANRFSFDIDNEGNFLVTFIFQNRIEKYSPEGKLIWKAGRVLNYSTKPLSKGLRSVDKYGTSTEPPNMNRVSFGIGVDSKGRIWVITLAKTLNKNNEQDYGRADMYKLEVFDSDGILLQEIPLDHAAHAIRVRNDQLLLLDHSRVKVYQYRIVEKGF